MMQGQKPAPAKAEAGMTNGLRSGHLDMLVTTGWEVVDKRGLL